LACYLAIASNQSIDHHQIQKYRAKISGPLLDRIDIQVEVPAVPYKDLTATTTNEPSKQIRNRVISARQIQVQRFIKSKKHCNAQMTSRQIKSYCQIDQASAQMLEAAIEKLGLSARAYNRVLKIARTIADLAGVNQIKKTHFAEAIGYRNLDRKTASY
jgi:magnesium chelatase family protein